jgi:molybdopterin-containing oxidoreductase family iron-sulfur binding subunit
MPHRTHIPIMPAGEPESAERRRFMKIMAASMALAGAGCSGPPQEVIVPYVKMPEMMVPGKPLYYASTFMHRGYAHGVLVESDMGRPTKVEGNPHHPASLGATGVFAQASVLQLWDPDRSQTVRQGEALSTWEEFKPEVLAQRAKWEADGGAGLRILTGTITSPTLIDQLNALLKRYPHARWHCHDPLHDDAGFDAAQLAFGRPVDMLYRFDRATVVVGFDADPFGNSPGAIRYARDFMRDRRSDAPQFDRRLYVLEASPGLFGAMADNRLAMPPHDIERTVWRIAARLGLPGLPPDIPTAANAQAAQWEQVLAERLAALRGASVIVAGGSLSPRTRALVHLMNAHLGNFGSTVVPIAPVEARPQNHAESMAALADDMRAGKVSALVMLETNPVYDAPPDIEFEQALRKVPFSVHHGLYRDETALVAGWHLPATHAYEQWSDGRAFDGTASIVQPVIAPLYQGRSVHELVSLLTDGQGQPGYALVRRFWQANRKGNFERFWQDSLRSGVIDNSASTALTLRPARTVQPPPFDGPALRALFAADLSVSGGEYANNAWLQELPRPFSTMTWDNAALISENTAHALGVRTGDVLRLSLLDRPEMAVEAPAWVWAGHADGAATLYLGYGRRAAGHVGNGVGFDAYRLRALRTPHALKTEKTGRHIEFATTQNHQQMEGRDIVRMAMRDEFRRNPHFANDEPRKRTPDTSLYPEWQYKDYKWGMAIDLNACIGCRACTIACQAENNIPVVGREEVRHGREMHWIRVDRYDVEHKDAGAHPRSAFQPVPCMHCEAAPCEEVCPVEAAVHDSEGLNVQVYNRCVGTRFCSNNCPYKVRRFNFLQYTGTPLDRPSPAYNPEVTVRRSGVMEKCTYCLQRITRGRIEAEKLGRRLRDGEVVTACQAVCPTEAIVFGDLNDPNSKVNRAKASPLDYGLLAELNTRPRTSYAAVVLNPDEKLGTPSAPSTPSTPPVEPKA